MKNLKFFLKNWGNDNGQFFFKNFLEGGNDRGYYGNLIFLHQLLILLSK